jgi:hypothetical protein
MTKISASEFNNAQLLNVEKINKDYYYKTLQATQDGALVNLKNPIPVKFGDSPSIDAFFRLRVSNPVTLFDSKNLFKDDGLSDTVENQPLFFDNAQTSGSGTGTFFDRYKAHQELSVSAQTAGMRVRQTRMRMNYQPAKSMLGILSFNLRGRSNGITKREGLFDEENGFFLELSDNIYLVQRSNSTGSVIDLKFLQSEWNLDKLDGTGPSGETLDFNKTQILFIDYEWLGVGRVRYGFVLGGVVYYAHEVNNANTEEYAYMSTPNLPIRSEISNDGTGDADSITQICSTIISEGGSKNLGKTRYISTSGTHLDANVENINYALLGIRLKPNYLGASVNLLNNTLQIQTASHRCEWTLIFNPIVSGTFTYTPLANSAIEVAVGQTGNVVTGGTIFAGGFLESSGNPGGGAGGDSHYFETALRLGSTIAGVSDQLVLCIKPIGGSSNVDVEGGISWRELL